MGRWEPREQAGDVRWVHRLRESGHVTSQPALSSRAHAHPAVPEERWLLWGLVAQGQQHLVRLGRVFRASGEQETTNQVTRGSSLVSSHPFLPLGSRPLC